MLPGKHEPKEVDRLIKCLKALDYLHKAEPETLTSLLFLLKFELDDLHGRDIRRFQDVAIQMINDDKVYQEVIRVAKQLILNPNVLEEFLHIINK